jgi:hypothetical protein
MVQENAASYSSARFARTWTICLSLVVLTLTLCTVQPANAAGRQLVAHNTPTFVSTAKKLGAEDPAKTIEVSVWLNLHNRAALDTLAQQLYDRTSPNYRHWLKTADLARFAPTAEEAATVRQFFESHNLKVVNVGPNNMFVRARGTVRDVQSAFNVTLNKYQVHGEVVRSNDRILPWKAPPLLWYAPFPDSTAASSSIPPCPGLPLFPSRRPLLPSSRRRPSAPTISTTPTALTAWRANPSPRRPSTAAHYPSAATRATT